MSAENRARLAKLRRQYATAFNIPLDDVEIEEWSDDEGRVHAPKYPELPKWTTG